jgi:hypothetical protein
MEKVHDRMQPQQVTHDARDELTVAGALRLARMLPVLEASRAPFLTALATIVNTRGPRPNTTVDEPVHLIRHWRNSYEPTQDVQSPPYLQALAAGIALAVAGIGDPADRYMKIEHSTANFWAICDDVVHRVDGYRSPAFAGLKTTLHGVENLWQRRDAEALASGLAMHEVFEQQIAQIQSSILRRREVAQVIARCAGWAIKNHPD